MQVAKLEACARRACRGIAGWRSLAAACGALLATSLVCAPAAGDIAGCEQLGAALSEHSCFHAEHGPFNTVQATSGSTPTSSTPDIDAVHTEHRVALADPAGRNVVTYSPVRSGQWVVFLGRDVPLAVYNSAGQALTVLRTDRGTTGCDALPIAHVFELNAGERYHFLLGPTDGRHLVVVVEYADDFVVRHGRDRDGDGWGDPEETTSGTACAAAPGYAEKVGDCDDDDPDVHPGAEETCDDVDRNCNGSPDDVGLQCRAGLGTCLRTGRFTCSGVSWGEPVSCDAIPGLPSQEQCNGNDDDCNGQSDDGFALCMDPEAPTCVRHGEGAFCGCLVDLDCGDPVSGRVCDSNTRSCVSGCSSKPGRNGCPDGLACSDAEGTIGVCLPRGMEPKPEPEPEPEPEPPATADRASGCSCDSSGSGPRGSGAWFLVAAAGALWFLRRRRLVRPVRSVHPLLGSALAVNFGALVACGGNVVTDDSSNGNAGTSAGASAGAPGKDPCVPLLASSPARHACSHANHGPFEKVLAVSSVDASAPTIDRIHVPYQIEFPKSSDPQGWLTYHPSRQGRHVFFTGAAAQLTIFAETDPPVSVLVSRAERSDSCSALHQADLVSLSKDTTYRVHLRALDAGDVPTVLFIEHLGTFGDEAFVHECE